MLKKSTYIVGFSLLIASVSGCIKHEVIPAPIPTADLTCSFTGNINGATIQYTEHVNGYEGTPLITSQQNITENTAQYLFGMESPQLSSYIRIGLGSIAWSIASGNSAPALTDFNDFFNTNDLPNYSDDALNGFSVTYHHSNGNDYKSRENSVNAQNVAFTNIEQESDSNGDYSKFICTFDCYLYYQDQITMNLDSIHMTNAVYQGWFKR